MDRIRRLEVRGPHTWKEVKDVTKNIDICGDSFDIPPECRARHAGLIPLKYFKNVDATPFVYDRFNRAWGHFPHHEHVPIYFAKHIYAEFVIHMRSDYTKTGSKFCGPSLGCSYELFRACRDPTPATPPPILFPWPSWSVVLPMEVEKSSQLSTDTRHNNGDNMRRKLAIPRVTLRGDMTRPPLFPHDPLVTLHDDSYLESLGHDQLFHMHIRVVIPFVTCGFFTTHVTQNRYIYMKLLTLIITFYIIYINKIVWDCIYIKNFVITCMHNPNTHMSFLDHLRGQLTSWSSLL